MKATIELPDALLREIKLKPVREGRKLKAAVADLLRKGLSADTAAPGAQASESRFPQQSSMCRDAYLAAFVVAGDYQLVTAFTQVKGLDNLVLGP